MDSSPVRVYVFNMQPDFAVTWFRQRLDQSCRIENEKGFGGGCCTAKDTHTFCCCTWMHIHRPQTTKQSPSLLILLLRLLCVLLVCLCLFCLPCKVLCSPSNRSSLVFGSWQQRATRVATGKREGKHYCVVSTLVSLSVSRIRYIS